MGLRNLSKVWVGPIGFILYQAALVAQVSPNRDFSLYAKPPLIVLDPFGNMSGYRAAQSLLREILWSSWTKKTRTIIRVRDETSKHGATSAEVYFVEPDEKGRWSIAIESEQDYVSWFMPPAGSEAGPSYVKKHRSLRFRAYFVSLIPDLSLSPEGQRKKKDSYWLLLCDVNGKKIETI